MTAATLVGLMSIPALAVLYGGLVQKKWAMNTVLMVFSTFCMVLIVWVLWAFKMGFGEPWIGGSLHLLGKPQTVLGTGALEGQANIPLLNGLMPRFRFPESSLVYFQFVFAAITPILFIGSVIGRISFKVWLIFVPLWITFAYAVNAFLLWGGGYWAGKGALDFSGGYVIHLAAGVSGFVAAWVVGPRLKRDREHAVPNNLLFVAVGAKRVRPARYPHVARQRAGLRRRADVDAGQDWRRVSERLPGVGERLGVHVVMVDRVPGDVGQLPRRVRAGEPVGDPLGYLLDVVQGLLA
jgi:Amt family ammonium transporter